MTPDGTPRRAAALAMLALAFLACDDAGPSDPGTPDPSLGLAVPIGGTMNQDWYLTNYVDGQPGQGFLDYACGAKSYDSHQGVDFVLPNFGAMDDEVPVLAAASGTVVGTHDGEPDRNKAWMTGVQWNVVAIDHGDDFEAWYGHLLAGSLRVTVGDHVQAGDTLGLVGSSGRSDMPHLHFELRYEDAHQDPFAGDCGAQVDHWGQPIPYQDGFAVIDVGITTDELDPGLERVKDPPTPVTAIVPGQMLYAWVQYHNVPAGAVTRWIVRRPDGTVHAEYTGSHEFYSMSWWWYGLPTGDFQPAGTWAVEIRHEGDVVAEHPFTVAAETPAVRGPSGPVAQGFGGGGIR